MKEIENSKYALIVVVSTIIIFVNYGTDFMFVTGIESLIFLWLFGIVAVYPFLLSFYTLKAVEPKNRIDFIKYTLICILIYAFVFLLSSIDYFNFRSLSFNGDRASNQILYLIFIVGFIFLMIALFSSYFKSKANIKKIE